MIAIPLAARADGSTNTNIDNDFDAGFDADTTASGAPPGHVGMEAAVARTAVTRLYADAMPGLASAVALALALWLLLDRFTAEASVLTWALLVHGCQLLQLGFVAWFRLSRHRPGAAAQSAGWLLRIRLGLCCMGSAWGAAALLWVGNDLALSALVVVVLLVASVNGVAGLAADRLSACLWMCPIVGASVVALLGHPSAANVGLAGLSLLIGFVNLWAVLKQNLVFHATLRAQFENAALVERLHRQVELTAAASRDKSRFLAAASHDLRQPLHALSFFGTTLERRMANAPDLPLIANMMRSIEALDRSFNAILDVSKLDAQAVEPHIQLFSIRDLFRRLQMSFGGQAEEAGLQLRFKAGSKVAKSDPQLLERALANLVQNALRYCQSGGVTVVARSWRGGINIEVWDTGIGIPQAEVPKIFDEFYQVANPERDRNKGLGIGLAIVARLMSLLDHPLTVHSRVGKGSVFRIWLKSSELAQMEEFTVGSDTLPVRIEEIRTVLLIDDEEAIRVSVSELLQQWGYTVLAVATASEALAAALNHEATIDVVISDLRLRGGEDGIHAIEQVRHVCGYTVPALLVTGDTAPDQVQRIDESGHIVLFKPVQPKDLYSVLKRMT